MPSRCEFCEGLSIATLRGNSAYRHHASLNDLKICADSNTCDICGLFWTAIKTSCHQRTIDSYLSGRPDDEGQNRDTTIFLWAFLHDLGTSPAANTPFKGSEGSGIQVSAGVFEHSRVHAFIGIFAEPDSAAAEYLIERNSILSSRGSVTELISKHWLKSCQLYHGRCGGTKPSQMPTRVIDLGDLPNQSPKLFVTEDCAGRYVALSYSWGDGVRHKVKLQRATLEPFQEAIPESSMTLAHRDALCIARALGYRYIWIDALCIIQGDKEDWAQQAVKIAAVYGNAELTIVAGRMDNSLEGFSSNSYTSSPPEACPILYSKTDSDGSTTELGTCFLGPKRSCVTGPVDKRAWCFQESVLSRRMIVYGEQQLSFKCRERSDWEDGTYILYRWGASGRYDLSSASSFDGNLLKDDVLRRWYELAQIYSTRKLWDPTDIFAALSGVASRFEQALGCRYLAGLWEGDMMRGLLWKSRRLFLGPHTEQAMIRPVVPSGDAKGTEVVRAPSWSWLALDGPSLQAIGKAATRMLNDRSSYRCKPAYGNKWSPDDWGPRTVKDFPLPCRLEVLGYPLEVHVSQTATAGYWKKPRWQHSRKRLNDHTFLLEPWKARTDTDNTSASQGPVVAIGLFDSDDAKYTRLWAMCLTSDEGLLLERNTDRSFCRLGVFMVEDESWFSLSTQRDMEFVVLQ